MSQSGMPHQSQGERASPGSKLRRIPGRQAIGPRLLFILLALCAPAFLTGSPVHAQSHSWATLDIYDGLPGNNVSCAFRDKDGNLWFGTDKGVARFDKRYQRGLFSSRSWLRAFTVRDGLPGNDVRAICEDRAGNLWFGTTRGLSRYDGTRFQNFTTGDRLPDNDVRAICEDRAGNLWLGTTKGLGRYDGKRFRNFTFKGRLDESIQIIARDRRAVQNFTFKGLLGENIQAIIEDRAGNLWLGTGFGVSRYDGKGFVTFITKDRPTRSEVQARNDVQAVCEDRAGNLWLGTANGLSRYDGKGFQSFTVGEGLPGTDVRAITQDRAGNLWLGTANGLSCYDGKALRNFSTEEGLPDEDIRAIVEDDFGSVWLGTRGGGASRYDGRRFQSKLAGDDIRALAQDRAGSLWLGAWGGGASRYDGKDIRRFTTEDGLPDENVQAICEDRAGNLWLGTANGLSRYDGKRFHKFTTEDGLAANNVAAIVEDRRGNLWLGTRGGGVSRYDGKRFQNFTSKDGLAEGDVQAICEDRAGNLWFGTWDNGVSRYDGKRFQNFPTGEGGPGRDVRAICEDRSGNLWFGTGEGASRYDGRRFESFTARNGLAGNVVLAIARDRSGNLWFGTENGVSHYDGRRFESFTVRDGLPGNKIQAIVQDRAGWIWLGTDAGVSRFADHILSAPVSRLGVVLRVDFRRTSYRPTPRVAWSYRLDNSSWTAPDKSSRLTLDYWRLGSGTHRLYLRLWDDRANPPHTVVIPFEVSNSERSIALALYLLALFVPLGVGGFTVGKRRAARLAVQRRFNPYRAGLPVGADLFTGREEVLRRLVDSLHNNCIYLQGERRMGKTSLLHHLARRLRDLEDPNFQFLPAFVDLQGVPEEKLWSALMAGVQEAVQRLPAAGNGSAPIPPPAPPSDASLSDFDFEVEFTTLLETMQAQRAKKVKFVLLLDEVDTLNTYDLRTNLALRRLFMGDLRENLVCVMSGFNLRMDWKGEGEGSPPFNYLVPVRLVPLSPEEARALVLGPVRNFYAYEPAAVERIVEASERRPFVIQSLCHRAIDHILDQRRRRVRLADVAAIQETTLAETNAILKTGASAQEMPADLTEALARIAVLERELRELRAAARASSRT